MRPLNCFLGSITFFIGLLNTVGGENFNFFLHESKNIVILLGGMLIFFLVAGGTNTINDYFDLEIDKINRPNRPIVRGALTKQHALNYYVLLNIVALSIAILLGLLSPNRVLIPLIVLLFEFLGFFYSWKAKASGFPGNILVGFASAVGIPFGGLFVLKIGDIGFKIWFMFIFAFFLLTSREFVKGMEDVEGDRQWNIKTVANTKGYKVAMIYLLIFSLITSGLFIYAIFLFDSSHFLIIPSIGGIIVIFLANILLLKDISNKELHSKSSKILKIAQIFGIFTFIAAAF